jgi:hypothetical protein
MGIDMAIFLPMPGFSKVVRWQEPGIKKRQPFS